MSHYDHSLVLDFMAFYQGEGFANFGFCKTTYHI
jgi:hypothetical protein